MSSLCCGAKKKKPEGPSQKPPSSVHNESKRQDKRPDISEIRSARSGRTGKTGQSKSVSRSGIKDATKVLKKSTVNIKAVDSEDVQLFENCRTEKLQINAVSIEHKNYVRREDYFKESLDISVSREAEPQVANYELASFGEIQTPPVNKFYYGRSGVALQKQ